MTKEELKRLAETGMYDIAPVSRMILSDIKTPIEVLRILKKASRHCYILESVTDTDNWGRYSFLGFDPKLGITCLDGELTVTLRDPGDDPGVELGDLVKGPDQICESDCEAGRIRIRNVKQPDLYIRNILKRLRSPKVTSLPPFTGGLVGYFAYDYVKYAEPSLKFTADNKEGFHDLDLMLFDKVIAFDHRLQKMILIVNVSLEDPEKEYKRGQAELDRMEELIRRGEPSDEISGRALEDFVPCFGKEEFCEAVRKVKHHILEGDIFQLVLSNAMSARYEGSLFNTYRMLRTINPSPYMFYFSGSDFEIAGASPETLVKLKDGVLHTFPLAGSRPRGKDVEEDERLKEELLKDPKELAEHNMLVDLGRNDLGKISKFGTVEVESLREVLKFSHIMHIGSTVRGIIRDDCDAVSAINAVLPAGTLSGAPKIKAMELIDRFEKNKRGIYGGAIGYIDFTGNMDTCIAIRLAYKTGDRVYVRSGAGLVYDSVPETEYTECINKAKAVVKAMELAEEVR